MIPVIEIVKDGEIKLTNGEESMVLPFSVVLQAAELIQDSFTIKKKAPRTILKRGDMTFDKDSWRDEALVMVINRSIRKMIDKDK